MQVLKKNKFIFNDNEISTSEFVNYIKLLKIFRNLFSSRTEMGKFTFYVYPYEFVSSQDIRSIQKITIKNKLILYSVLNETDKYPSIVKYRPFSPRFFHWWELLQKFNLIKKNILEYSNYPSALEAIHYYERKYKNSLSNYNLYYTGDNCDYINVYREYINMKMYNDTKLQKFDLIINNNFYFKPKQLFMLEHINLPILIKSIIWSINHLNVNGNLIIVIEKITTKPMADLIIILQKIFKKVHIYYNQINNLYKLSGHVLICKKFNGKHIDLQSVYNKIKNTNQNINEPEIRKELKIKEPADDVEYKYTHSILSTKSNDKIYDFIRDFNRNLYFNKCIYLRKLIKFKQNYKKNKYRGEQLTSSILWCQKYDIDFINFDKKLFTNQFTKLITIDMFKYHNPILYKFNTHHVNDFIDIPDDFNKIKRAIWLNNFIIDTRDINKWNNIKKLIRYYTPKDREQHLTKLIDKKFNTGKISQAWIKMYEILNNLNIVPKNLHSFHICESPGQFISAIDYYIKNQLHGTFNWNAQSLNPSIHKNKSAFGDQYGLIKKHPNRWHWGVDNTGDITNIDNMKYYLKFTKNVNLITSDCGLPWTHENDNSLLIVHYASLIFILLALPKKSNFVAKMVAPIYHPIQIDILFTIFNCFHEMIFYKPIVNPFSLEFYLIGKKFKGIDEKILNKHINLLKNFDPNKKVYSKYPANFIYQLIDGLSKLADHYLFNFNRQLYYVDNINSIPDQELKLINKIIQQKNNDWVDTIMSPKSS